MTRLTTTVSGSSSDPLVSTIADLRALSIRALSRMYRSETHRFVFCVRRNGEKLAAEGVSRRYTAIALLGLTTQDDAAVKKVLGGEDARELCGRLLADVHTVDNIGDVALTLWAAAALRHESAGSARDRLIELDPCGGEHATVELAWCVTALSIDPNFCNVDGSLVEAAAERLMASFVPESDLFPHWPVGVEATAIRSHVTCFADLVYPTQALAHYHMLNGNPRALDLAQRCARRICDLQGPEGQWWWHFDSRTGRVVERFPVYAVHQDAMAPMALFAVQDAGGDDYGAAIRRGLDWLVKPSETNASLIDRSADLIWRKVARHEPNKLSRGVQAVASRLHPDLRAPGLGMVFRPGAVDYECRPYHLGWLLYAWSNDRKVP